jgi:GTPase SAR1 family protein
MGANMGKTNGGSLLENLTLPSTHPTLHIVMLGLDSAGKTTALYRLKFDQYVNTVRFISFFESRKQSHNQNGCHFITGAHHRLQLRENPRLVGQSQGYSVSSLGCR